MRVAGIDVGILNMAHCVLEVPGDARVLSLRGAAELLARSRVVLWECCNLKTESRRVSTTDALDMAAKYVESHEQDFAACDHVVIEQQPAAKMRNISVALYVLIRRLGPRVTIQSARKKLQWGRELNDFVPGADISTYYRRKKTSILLTRALFAPQQCEVFEASAKKDDLADALLHCLASLATRTSAQG